eukprot:CAMPEP_0204603740 /NCGR_PEP_ID=MMETSP0661-20131031/57451_1 /ASSEMBLY_ACC=CAM_ASM_000606 /TAXON_ID=109239 /ORGANISM="Alexandrium margalefi, Strain AMGDE01CS-322" /LENGTH=51 /DNA_ID=CAMNT_0051614841 /DNA_START=77 /DNA_END=232 /DNA_ORIENTATION=+
MTPPQCEAGVSPSSTAKRHGLPWAHRCSQVERKRPWSLLDSSRHNSPAMHE